MTSVRIGMVGDIYFKDDDSWSVVEPVSRVTTSFEIMLGNLEIPLCNTGTAAPKANGRLRQDPKHVDTISRAGFTGVTLANNHAMNFGAEGLSQMIRVLDSAGIAHAGGGDSIIEAHSAALLRSNQMTVALLSYTSVYARNIFESREDRPGLATVRVDTLYEIQSRHFEVPGMPPLIRTIPAGEDLQRVRDDISKARSLADVVVVGWHWGYGIGNTAVIPYQVELAHFAIDNGADVVMGHHPHVLQPIEFYKGKVICYSLGNFSHALEGGNFPRETAVIEIESSMEQTIEAVRVYPLWFEDEVRPLPLSVGDERVVTVLERLGNGSVVRMTPDGDLSFRVVPNT
ncbi:MAG TPA: CapA family protein [Acidimicrobiales bacterium]|nr:CapA family protein [Acidimicrobiales bacterium]